MVGKPPNNSPSPIPRPPSKTTQVPDPPPRLEAGLWQPPHPTEVRSPSTYVGQSSAVPLITTPVAVSVIPIPELSSLHSFVSVSAGRSLEDFRVPVLSWPPNIEAHGIWQFKERLYVAVDDGYFVQVARDPFTGYLRATMSRERAPSGPILQRDPVSAFWRPVAHPDGAAITPAPGHAVSRQVAQLFQQLGYPLSMFPDVTVRRILAVGGIEEARLPGSEASTALLADTLRRFRLDQDLQAFVAQMQSPDPSVYTRADPQLQIQLLQARGVNLYGNALREGDLLRSLVASLDVATLKTLLDEPASVSVSQRDIDATLARLQQRMGAWAQRDRVKLFRSREEAFEFDCDENTLQMRRIFPSLTKNAAQALWRNASAAERLHVHNLAGMPRAMVEEALLLQRDVRLTRACEGLYLDSVCNPDSDRLALHMIGNLAGWPHSVRIEIRQGETFLGAIGDARSPDRYILLRQDAGYFIEGTEALPPQSARDLYSVVWHVLNLEQRQALAGLEGRGNVLQQLIRTQPLPSRQTVIAVLDLAPMPFAVEYFGVPYKQSGHLRGGSDDNPNPARSVEDRVRDLYPELSDVGTFIHERLHSNPSGVLIKLEQEWVTLRQELEVWSADVPPHPMDGIEWSAEALVDQLQLRQKFSQALQAIWQQSSITPDDSGGESFSAFIDFTGELPLLSARFEGVTELVLEARNPGVKLGSLLDCFPNVRYLIIEKVRMEKFAPGIFQMRDLRHLILKDCSLRLSDVDAEGLSRVETLTLLRLDKNPLSVAPHVGFMRQMEELYLSDTGITEMPSGIERLNRLRLLDLRDNHIVDVSDELFEIPDTQKLYVNMIDNPLSDAALMRIRAYLENASLDSEIVISTQEPALDDAVVFSDSSESGIESEGD